MWKISNARVTVHHIVIGQSPTSNLEFPSPFKVFSVINSLGISKVTNGIIKSLPPHRIIELKILQIIQTQNIEYEACFTCIPWYELDKSEKLLRWKYK